MAGSTQKSTQTTIYACEECDNVHFSNTPPHCCNSEMVAIQTDPIRSPEFEHLLRDVFELSAVGLQICLFLIEAGDATASEVAPVVDIDESTARRQLRQLVDLGAAERTEKLRTNGGSVYVYTPAPLDEHRKQLKIKLYAWVDEALDIIDELEQQKLEAAAQQTKSNGSDSPTIYRE